MQVVSKQGLHAFLQAMSENKSWRHRWFKPDKHGKAAPAQQQQQQQGRANLGDKSPAAGPFAAEGSTGSTSSKAQQPQGGSGWSFSSMFGKKEKARAAAAAAAAAAATASIAADGTAVAEADHGAQDGAECQQHEQEQQPACQEQQEPQQQLQHVLQLVGDQLGELAVSICQNAGQAASTLQAAAAGSMPAGMSHTQAAAAEPIQLQAPTLQHLEELQQHQEGIPEVCLQLNLTCFAAFRHSSTTALCISQSCCAEACRPLMAQSDFMADSSYQVTIFYP